MTMRRIPQYGDPELLPKPTVSGPTMLDPALLESADIEGLPWRRARGDEWTTTGLRRLVFDWLIDFIDARPHISAWEVVEKASAVRSGRLPPEQYHLVFRMTRKAKSALSVVETAIAFPVAAREDQPDIVRATLNQAGVALDALLGDPV